MALKFPAKVCGNVNLTFGEIEDMYVFFVPPKHKLFRGGYKNILAKKKKKSFLLNTCVIIVL